MMTTVSPRSKIPADSLIELYCLDMSLLARLKAVQTEVEVPLTDLSQLTLAELKTEVVSFGQKHQGETYETAWEDQGWINFMVSKYGTSKVLSHRRLIRFVELMVEHHERTSTRVPVLPPPESVAGGYALIGELSRRRSIRARAKAKAMSTVPSGVTEPIPLDQEEELEFEMFNQGTTATTPLHQDPEFTALQDRILNMENALGRVIKHLEDQIEKQ
jgi:hypothetical protein